MNKEKHENSRTIKYIGHYDILRNGEQKRVYSLAAAKKMDFIAGQLVKIGFKVNIVSAAHSSQQGGKHFPQIQENIADHIDLTTTPTRQARNKFDRIIRVLQSKIWLFFYLLRTCQNGDPVIVYHHYEDAIPIVLAQKIKGFKLILQIEEQYSMVWELSKYKQWKERILLSYGKKDALVVSELLAKHLQVENPIISYGSYNTYQGEILKHEGEEIVLVFTGMIETVRNGAFMSLETMKYLPRNYKLFVSGPIEGSDEVAFYEAIKEVNTQCGRPACEYMGVLDDEQYKGLLLKADIALNPQREGDFGDFVFPSKILTYMGYGLPVVSTKGGSIVHSELNDIITFSEDFTPKSVAEAVQSIECSDADEIRNRIRSMEIKFNKKLSGLLEGKVL